MVPGGGDAYFYLWDLWWFKKALLSASSPYFTQYIFYPAGINLAFSAITPFNGILSIPLQSVFGLTKAYNILFLTSFIISGYGTYLLVKYLTGNSKAAFISGLIFMFSPYHFAHSLSHLNLMSIEWIPFYVLFLLKTINEKSSKNAIYAAFFLLLVFLSEYTYAVYLSFFTVFFLLYYAYEDKNYIVNKFVIKKLSLMGICFIFLSFPFAYPLFKELLVSKSSYMYNGGFVAFSADLLGFFIPSTMHPVFNQFVDPIYQNFTGNFSEFTVFAGYTVLILSTIASLKIKTKEIKFWVLCTVVTFIFCLGPVLHINGIFTSTIENVSFAIPLPYAIVMKIPIISIARAPSRWDSIVMLNLSVLSGYGLSYIYTKFENHPFRSRFTGACITILFASLILFEFLAIPYPMATADIPEFYWSLSKNPEDFAIYEIPDLFDHLGFTEFMYYQTTHEKKIVTGNTKVPESYKKFTEQVPLINNLYFTYIHPVGPKAIQNDIINQNTKEIGSSILNYYNIKYVILHENYMTAEQLKFAKNLLNDSIDDKPVYYKNDSMSVYRVKSLPIKPFEMLGDGWQNLENWNGVPTRWISSNASLFIYSDKNYSAMLRVHALSFYCTRNMSVYNEGSVISTVEIPPKYITAEIPVKLNKGENFVRFQVLDGSERPCDIPSFNSIDSRNLGVAIQNMTVTNKIEIPEVSIKI